MSTTELDEMGPIDYVLIEWPARHPTGEIAPLWSTWSIAGSSASSTSLRGQGRRWFRRRRGDRRLAEPGRRAAGVRGRIVGLLTDDDPAEAASALDPGTSAALLVFENRWAAPFAVAVRRSGGQLVANGGIPIQAVLAALDAAEDA